jgi:hypothetical protein
MVEARRKEHSVEVVGIRVAVDERARRPNFEDAVLIVEVGCVACGGDEPGMTETGAKDDVDGASTGGSVLLVVGWA